MAYYGFLATRVAPRRLLATAARRAIRGASRRLAPAPEAPAEDRILEAFGASDPQRLAQRLLARPRPARPAWTPDALRSAL
ncbi:MAG TPA: heparinase, partial [Anaeromyxobacteraceae bacterium]|nr:heparinase [Anaeromyxobacteraceae bacterium]